ncbi:MAG: alpha/beta fold hydrolase [Pseudomonadota bacterium]
MTISPSGKRVAYLQDDADWSRLVVVEVDGDISLTVDISRIKARYARYLTEKYVVLGSSAAGDSPYYTQNWEYRTAFAINTETREMRQLLRRSPSLARGQSTQRIIGVDADGEHVFMPAFTEARSGVSTFDIFKVNLETGRGRPFQRGTSKTVDWVVDDHGKPLARETFNNRTKLYRLKADAGAGLQTIFEAKDNRRAGDLLGIMPDTDKLVLSRRTPLGQKLSTITFSGDIGEGFLERSSAFIDDVLLDRNRVFGGVRYSGMLPSHEFFDPSVDDAVRRLASFFPKRAVTVKDWTSDQRYLIVKVAGSMIAPSYYYVDTQTDRLVKLASAYDGISDADTAEVIAIQYPARDGEKIPAIVTLPRGQTGKRLPMIALPHGGPEAYDQIGFNWMAQYFASRGYLVFQPNFRGSSGFGRAFAEAGYGGWGRGVMQHDVTDGVLALISSGWADGERVCIIGASYGGYAALAGGAFTPELYDCVAAIAPVTDVRLMLRRERRSSRNGRGGFVYEYWKRSVGAEPGAFERLDEISPARNADEFVAPVLLIHGEDDSVVDIRQSRVMARALQKAGKEVEFVKLKGEDHWLSTSETRIETLRELDSFVRRTIGPDR